MALVLLAAAPACTVPPPSLPPPRHDSAGTGTADAGSTISVATLANLHWTSTLIGHWTGASEPVPAPVVAGGIVYVEVHGQLEAFDDATLSACSPVAACSP